MEFLLSQLVPMLLLLMISSKTCSELLWDGLTRRLADGNVLCLMLLSRMKDMVETVQNLTLVSIASKKYMCKIMPTDL